MLDKEYLQLRGLPGQLNWVCNKTRPDISFHSSHANMSLKNATIDILPANKIVTKLKSPGPILEFKWSVRHVQKGHPTLVRQVDLISQNR